VKVGFKEIEVGFPAASETEYTFLRALIERNMIPDDVTIQVLTQAREHIIRKTFEAVKGAPKAVVHLYNSTSVAQREQVFKKNKEEIKKLNDRIDNILNRMVTGVIIQGTECPVIGYFNTPLDIRSQLLAAYYGSVDSKVEFPSAKEADYVDFDEFWTDRNVEVIGGPDKIRNAENKATLEDKFVAKKNQSEEGNAGTLYMTVNPAEVNYEGQTVTLESSTGETAGILLSPLKRSDRELTFGYTRAANNGFYEAAATLTVGNIENAKVRINYKDLGTRLRLC
jgi:hypothetical protein